MGVVLDTGPDWGVVAALVREAHLTVATAKLGDLALAGAEAKRSRSQRRA